MFFSRRLSILVVLGFLSSVSFSQTRQCDSDAYLEQEISTNPRRLEILKEIELHTQDFVHLNASSRSTNIVTIPVVVHVVYKNDNENISKERILSQIDALNADFRRLNSNKTNTWTQAADTQIEFCLAIQDPYGMSTDGITRTKTTVSSFNSASDGVKYSYSGGKDAWPRDAYLNIWVCDVSGSILGYAQLPGGTPEKDGIVIDYASFGTTDDVLPPFNLGRTTTHEVGHWLNLRHIWGASDCSTDDYVDDTPKANRPHYNCEYGASSCGAKNMIENYMDYSDDACMSLFTAGQKSRMQALFAVNGFRYPILSSKGCIQPDGTVQSSCQDFKVELTFDNYPTETSWSLINAAGNIIFASPKYTTSIKGKTETTTRCLDAGCYTFNIYDTYKDGICCKYGQGKVRLINGDSIIFEGGSFGAGTSFNFCIESPQEVDATCEDHIMNGSETGIDCGGTHCPACPTCSDNIQNGTETGVDCGGSACDPCETETDDNESVTIPGAYFESGWDQWTGGYDTKRYQGNFAFEGDYALQIQDNSGLGSTITSPIYDLHGFSSVGISFAFYPNSLESGESFALLYFDGTQWHTVKTYKSGQDFHNGTFYEATLILTGAEYTFATNSKFAFECIASTNADQVYIDKIEITGNPTTAENRITTNGYYIGEVPDIEIQLFPNPAQDHCIIQCAEEIENIHIYNATGQEVIRYENIFSDKQNVITANFDPGIFVVFIEIDGKMYHKKLIIQ
ncbi:MAG: M43 family zinc metalloprotease [Saprospiraceae bacterium]